MAKKLCRCGAGDVTYSDHAEHRGGWLVVHGELHCYTVPSVLAPSHRRRNVTDQPAFPTVDKLTPLERELLAKGRAMQ